MNVRNISVRAKSLSSDRTIEEALLIIEARRCLTSWRSAGGRERNASIISALALPVNKMASKATPDTSSPESKPSR